MSYKTRSNYKLGLCLKKCANRDIKCKECLKFSEYKEALNGDTETTGDSGSN